MFFVSINHHPFPSPCMLLTFNTDDMFPDLVLQDGVLDSLQQVVDRVDIGMDTLESLDLGSDGRRVGQLLLVIHHFTETQGRLGDTRDWEAITHTGTQSEVDRVTQTGEEGRGWGNTKLQHNLSPPSTTWHTLSTANSSTVSAQAPARIRSIGCRSVCVFCPTP